MGEFAKISIQLAVVFIALLKMSDAVAPTGSEKFAVNLYQNCVKEKGGNVIISPKSVETALALAFMGAKGQTAEGMAKGLELASTDKEALAKSMEQSSALFKAEGSPVSIANKVYVMTGHSIKPAFHDVAVKSFDSETQSLDFAQNVQAAGTINQWVELKTHDKIKDLISSDQLNSDTRMVLVNAIYFKGLWENKFTEERTKKADFWVSNTEAKQVDMMYTKASFKYGNIPELNAAAIELPYKGPGNLSMLVILPNEKEGLADLENKLQEVSLNDITKKMWKQEVNVWLPKFKVEYDLSMKNPLIKMGMSQMFSDAADFSDLLDSPEGLKVSDVVHKAFIEVNEEGTEAAAATAVLMCRASAFVESPPKFLVDKPFLYIIRQSNGDNLFVGSVSKF